MNHYPVKRRIIHFFLHSICILRITYQLILGKIDRKIYKEKINFFIQGILRSATFK